MNGAPEVVPLDLVVRENQHVLLLKANVFGTSIGTVHLVNIP